MKNHLFLIAAAGILSAGSFISVRAQSPFVHPGLSLNRAELDLIKSEVNESVQPRKAGWLKMLAEPASSLSYAPHARATVLADGGTSQELSTDALAAYSHALQWYVTGNEANAKKAVQILNAWSSVLQKIENNPNEYSNQEILVAGWVGQPLAEAAEIIRYSYTGWSGNDIARFEDMLKRVFYPLIMNNTKENGNWEASQINSMIAIGIFTNDKVIFDRGVSFFGGTGRGAVGVYVYASGECQETCRDYGHPQMGMGELVDAAEMAWKQGVDLYSLLPDPTTKTPRLAEGLEFMGKILNGVAQNTTCGTRVQDNGGLEETWEKAWNHYGNRMKLDLPYIKRCADRGRPEASRWTAMYAYGTLTHYNLVIQSTSINQPPKRALSGRNLSGSPTAIIRFAKKKAGSAMHRTIYNLDGSVAGNGLRNGIYFVK